MTSEYESPEKKPIKVNETIFASVELVENVFYPRAALNKGSEV